ncbi:DUF4124 domain-containing protein [Acinetobacter baumannii]|uniref:DUF4124 domain-containing protein n=1 Tax=Acinetobacter baumannii TaxID=470 RepID=UPI000668C2AA|nr:DUF4124 domain-containing protein [Acinetobacter baumannii]HAV5498947.1 DUF4124 domain-containing protein [Acinetobacter baumannii]HCA5016690.1 DUF4124 domain-containing protein [Acinetobacter baumannii]HCA5018353.1 DUF4124 domain-containing protein [Acinetobacter baumannii]
MNLSYLKTSLYTATTTAILLCSSQSQAQQYYKWMDQSGSTHYTTTPPPKGAKHLNKVSTYGSQPLLKNPTSKSEQPSQDNDKVVQEVTNVAVEKGAPAVQVPPAPSVSAPR